jgi:hypothetical protein
VAISNGGDNYFPTIACDSGRQIKERANLPEGFALYRRTRGGNESIRDDDTVDVHEGDHFFARPSASRRTLDDVQEEVSR